MKQHSIYKTIFAAAVLTAGLIACRKNPPQTMTYRATTDQQTSYVRIIHAAPSFRTIMGNKDSFNVIYANSKMNGAFLTYGSIYPSATYTGIYSGSIPFQFQDNDPNSTSPATFHSFVRNLEPEKYYSLIITDSIRSNNPLRQMWVQDNFVQPDTGSFGIRFIHAVWNDTAGRTIDLFSTNRRANLFTGIAAGTVTEFIYPKLPTATDTLIVRRSGTGFELARLNTVGFGNRRVVTYIYRGNGNTPPSGAAALRPRGLISYTNL